MSEISSKFQKSVKCFELNNRITTNRVIHQKSSNFNLFKHQGSINSGPTQYSTFQFILGNHLFILNLINKIDV